MSPIRTPSSTEIANPISFATGAANLANRLWQHCGTEISPDRDTTPSRREAAGLCASLPTPTPGTAAKVAENRSLSWGGGQIRRETDCLLEERVSCELVSGNPNFTPKKSFGEISGYQGGISGSIGAPRDALSGCEIKRLRIFAPYTRACTRVRPTKERGRRTLVGRTLTKPYLKGLLTDLNASACFGQKEGSTTTLLKGETRPVEPSSAQLSSPSLTKQDNTWLGLFI